MKLASFTIMVDGEVSGLTINADRFSHFLKREDRVVIYLEDGSSFFVKETEQEVCEILEGIK